MIKQVTGSHRRHLRWFCAVVFLLGCASQRAPVEPSGVTLQSQVLADHQKLLMSKNRQLAENKRLVYDMWRTLVDAHDIDAARKYLSRDYIQHDPVFDTGRRATLSFFAAFRHPRPVLSQVKANLIAVVAEKDLVAFVQEDRQTYPSPYSTTWIDLFRIRHHQIVEHWDHSRLPAGEMPQHYVPVRASSDIAGALRSVDRHITENKRTIYDLWQGGHLPGCYSPDCVSHDPRLSHQTVVPGETASAVSVRPLVRLIAEGDLVVLATQAVYEGLPNQFYTTTWFDMYRMKAGQVTEHWNTARLPLVSVEQ